MGRSESKQAFQDSQANQKQNQTNAQAALGGENQAIGDFQNSVGNYGNFIWDTFRPGGEFMQDATTAATSANSGGNNSYQDFLSNMGNRTGTGTTPQMVAASEEASRQGKRDVAKSLLTADQERIAGLGAGLQTVMQEKGAVPGMYGSQYATSLGGANSALGNETEAGRTPGFWDTFLPALAGGAATVGAGFAKSCWIAEAIYGVDDQRTHLLREWLNTEFRKSLVGKAVMALYLRFGRRIAALVTKYPTLRSVFRPIFDRGLQKAIAHLRKQLKNTIY